MNSNITERGKTIILSKIDLHFNQISELKSVSVNDMIDIRLLTTPEYLYSFNVLTCKEMTIAFVLLFFCI